MVILMLIFIHNVHNHAHSHAQIQRPCLRSCPGSARPEVRGTAEPHGGAYPP